MQGVVLIIGSPLTINSISYWGHSPQQTSNSPETSYGLDSSCPVKNKHSPFKQPTNKDDNIMVCLIQMKILGPP